MTEDIDGDAWHPLRAALTVATYDIGILLPRSTLLRLFEATVDELVEAGCELLVPDDEPGDASSEEGEA
jgi:hypothetical protein